MVQEEEGIEIRHRRRYSEPEVKHDVIFKIRQILNWCFIILAIAGGLLYTYGVWYRSNSRIELMGVIIVVIAVVVKMSECMLRMKK